MNNRYTIQRELGQGGMAIVHLAEDTRLHSPVALKVLRKEMASNNHIHKRFVSEARSMFRMAHPNIIKVIDLIDDDDTVAIVMEYVEGETLKQYLDRKSKLSDYEIKDLLSQMLDALEYVHEQGLVHRDIKPSNFMITPKGKVKLMDFGIAKQTDPNSSDYTSTSTTQQMGTPMYMSPEQIHETKNVTAQSDIYSLGVVLWQMVTGKRPYDTQTLSTFQLQSKIVNEPLEDTNTKWDQTIRKATAKEITLRYSSANAFKNGIGNSRDNVIDSTVIDEKQNNTLKKEIDQKEQASYSLNSEQEKTPSLSNRKNQKKSKRLLYLIIFVFAIILIGFNINYENLPGFLNSNNLPNEVDKSEKLNESSMLGAWIFNAHYLGKVFLQFESDGILRVFYNYEGEQVEIVNWELIQNRIVTKNTYDEYTIFDWPLGLESYVWKDEIGGLKIEDFNGNEFKLNPFNNQFSDDTPEIIVSRLFDEAGEPIMHYSLFQRKAEPDRRYLK